MGKANQCKLEMLSSYDFYFLNKATMKRIRKKSNYEENERNIEYEKKSSYEENERNIELLKSPTRPPLTIWVQN